MTREFMRRLKNLEQMMSPMRMGRKANNQLAREKLLASRSSPKAVADDIVQHEKVVDLMLRAMVKQGRVAPRGDFDYLRRRSADWLIHLFRNRDDEVRPDWDAPGLDSQDGISPDGADGRSSIRDRICAGLLHELVALGTELDVAKEAARFISSEYVSRVEPGILTDEAVGSGCLRRTVLNTWPSTVLSDLGLGASRGDVDT